MSYLFDRDVETAIAKSFKLADTARLKEKCEAATLELRQNHTRRADNYLADDATAEALVTSMGSKSRRDRGNTPANAPHALDYVGRRLEDGE